MTIELKIKNKHLSEEAKIIRFEERKLLKKLSYQRQKHADEGHNGEFHTHDQPEFRTYLSLNSHRREDVRNENRATYLARAFIEGKSYKEVEAKRKEEKEHIFQTQVLPRVATMVAKYSYSILDRDDYEWKNGRHIATQTLRDKIAEWSNK